MFSGNTSQVSADQLYVEDVFSTWLYTGTGAAQTITNGIDLAGKGGMVWAKARSSVFGNAVFDTVRGSSSGNARRLITNSTVAATTTNEDWLSFNSNGFTANADPGGGIITTNGTTYASWTFRKAPKFFDVVTYTGNGGDLTINHSLGVQPGCIIIKKYSASGDWLVSHRYNFGGAMLKLNATDAAFSAGIIATATTFRVFGGIAGNSDSGATYVAYLFAHDTTSDGIIQCGSFTATNGSSSTVNLGWEPQWLMMKISSSSGDDWKIFDNMRGLNAPTQNAALLKPNTSEQEYAGAFPVYATSTGFTTGTNLPNATYVYIAIRRGPMKTPTLGTSVFAPVARTGTGANATVSSGFVTDMVIEGNRFSIVAGTKFGVWDRMRSTSYLLSTTTNAEGAAGTTIIQANPWDVMDGYNVGTTSALTNASANQFINWMFRRAPGFFDEVCYTGTGVARTVNHNLGVAPELVIVKSRNISPSDWRVNLYNALGSTTGAMLNSSGAAFNDTTAWNSFYPTSTQFGVGSIQDLNSSGATYVAYLFASCPGVSKVGSYTGNGSSQTINCGFAAGARFVMIKRTDNTGDWYVWDTARGIVAGNDPYLSLNVTNGDITSNDTIDTDSSGFVVNQVAATNVNVSSATYIYLAIA